MSGHARVDNVEALQTFRTSLVKFAETVQTSLTDAESEAQRVLVWLETEADTFWQGQIRKRHEDVERCKDAVRQKKLYKSPTGNTQSAVEEEKMLRIAQRKLEEAEQKLKNVRRYAPRLQKELQNYKGGVQRLMTDVMADVPVALSRLDKMVTFLSAYAALSINAAGQIDETGEAMRSMARALGELAAREDYSPLRKKTAAVARAAGTPADIRLEAWSDGLVTDREREMVEKINAEHVTPPPEATVVVEAAAWEATRIYLERVTPGDGAPPGDSGWFLGRADNAAPPGSDDPAAPKAVLAIPVQALLEARSDLREILDLPTGFLAVIGETGIQAILDDRGADLWQTVANVGPAPAPPSTPSAAPGGAPA